MFLQATHLNLLKGVLIPISIMKEKCATRYYTWYSDLIVFSVCENCIMWENVFTRRFSTKQKSPWYPKGSFEENTADSIMMQSFSKNSIKQIIWLLKLMLENYFVGRFEDQNITNSKAYAFWLCNICARDGEGRIRNIKKQNYFLNT